jgi:hypothetical protein
MENLEDFGVFLSEKKVHNFDVMMLYRTNS